MISVEKAVIARLTKSGEKFEIIVDPEKAMDLKTGKEIVLEDLLASEEIYEDAKKGLRASNENVNKAFGTNDLKKIVYTIIKEGEVQITTEQRKRMLEEKTKAIANIIAKRGVNPQTGLPHPADRILRAMEQSKVRIDLERRIEEQIDEVLKKIQTIIPIKFERIQIAIKIPPSFAGKASNIVRSFGTLLKDEWAKDGSYICLIEIPAGIQQEVYDRLNNLTHGQVEVKVVKKV
ncbi:MAG: ribosome assembly factor SBDS [Candidatus Aenigmarchaeota archaeon]|nr:ribosome assembly factor SBDS [Candidatus Aenigmarchaeota archaeon]